MPEADSVFIDTNILVNAGVLTAPLHHEALQALTEWRRAGYALWISRQVLREYVAVLSRPQLFSQPVAITALADQVRQFERLFHVSDENASVTALLLDLLEHIPTGGRQVHDANIVATMRCYGVPRLLTHNVADFSRFSGLISVIPLVPNV